MITRFFLADDDQDDVNFFSEALTEIDPGVELRSANNGRALLEQLRGEKRRPEVIFLDINMPEMNGWEALDRLKSDVQWTNIPVIMYSTSSSKTEGRKAVAAGALCFYEKPPSFLKLKDFLRSIVASNGEKLEDTVRDLIAGKSHKIYK